MGRLGQRSWEHVQRTGPTSVRPRAAPLVAGFLHFTALPEVGAAPFGVLVVESSDARLVRRKINLQDRRDNDSSAQDDCGCHEVVHQLFRSALYSLCIVMRIVTYWTFQFSVLWSSRMIGVSGEKE